MQGFIDVEQFEATADDAVFDGVAVCPPFGLRVGDSVTLSEHRAVPQYGDVHMRLDPGADHDAAVVKVIARKVCATAHEADPQWCHGRNRVDSA